MLLLRNNSRFTTRHTILKKALTTGAAVLATGTVGHLSTSKASATPSTLGFYPSTDIYGRGVFHYDADSYGRATRADAAVTTGLTYGIGPDRDGIFGRSEVGLDYTLSLGGVAPSSFGVEGQKRLTGNIKTQLFNNDASATRVVAGIWGIGDAEIFAPNVAYVTGSRSFQFGRVHLGLARSLSDRSVVATPSGNSDRTNLHLGYDRYFANNKLQFAVDYYSGKSGYSGIQPTLYYYINDKANFGLGLMRFNDSTVAPARNQVYLCFDYNFGGSTPPVVETTPTPETAPGAPATN
ncbi:MAG: hypothetical protein JWN98_164 [Abditibacteriota bacterium]|nr:hypothetical protein [Abditibacteriota bacterium]